MPKFTLSLIILILVAGSGWTQQTEQLTPLNSLDRIELAYQQGEIGYSDALLNKIYAVLDRSRLDPRFKMEEIIPIRCATPILEEFQRNRDQLSRADQILVDDLLARNLLDSKETYISPGGKFNLHFSRVGEHAVSETDVDPANGIPDYVEQFGEIFDYVWQVLIEETAYKAPYLGGNKMQEVYIENLESGVLGYVSGRDNLHMRNNYIGYGSQFDLMQVTAAHEFHHEVQLSYHYPLHPSTWYMEATSMWVEDYVYDDINDYVDYLYSWYNTPWISLTDESNHWYSCSIWNFYLEENYGTGIIREIWEDVSPISVTATENVLGNYDTDFQTEFQKFESWNYFTSFRAAWEHPTFEEAALFPAATLQNSHSLTASVMGVPLTAVVSNKYPEKLACNYIRFNNFGSEGILVIHFEGEDLASWGGYVITDSGATHTTADYPLTFLNETQALAIVPGWSELNGVVLIPTNTTLFGSGTPRAYSYWAEVVNAVVFILDYEVTETAGNGNGSLEAGETGSLVVQISNYGNDLENVSLRLSTANPVVTLNTAELVLGAFPGKTTIDNTADPFVFQLAEEVDPQELVLTLHVEDNEGEITAEEIRFNIGLSNLLLVDNDAGTTENDILIAALDSLGILYDRKDVGTSGLAGLALDNRQTVIWALGRSGSQSISGAVRDSLARLFNSGKNLLLAGPWLAQELGDESWFPAEGKGSTTLGWLKGREGDLLGQNNLNWLWSASSSGNELLQPVDPRAQIAFQYNGGDGGLLRYCDRGRVVLADFAFADLTRPSSAFLTPSKLLTLILDYFDHENKPPSEFYLQYPEANADAIFTTLTDSMTFLWTAASDTDTVTYTFVLDSSADFRRPFLLESGALSETAYNLAALNLLEMFGTQGDTLPLFWGVYASDGQEVRLADAMNPVTLISQLPNLPPEPFSLLNPAQGAPLSVTDLQAEYRFRWQRARDPEGRELRYHFKLGADANFNSALLAEVTEDTLLDFRGTELYALFASPQVDSLELYWTVQALDREFSISADTVAFYLVNGINLAPGAFALLSPANGDTVEMHPQWELIYFFNWFAAVDPNGDAVNYRVTFYTGSIGDTTEVAHYDVSDTSLGLYPEQMLAFLGGEVAGWVHWYVTARDVTLETISNAEFKFYLIDLSWVRVQDIAGTNPAAYRLYANYPNPFNAVSSICFDLPEAAVVELAVFDLLGNRIATLVTERRNAGSYQVDWNSTRDSGQPVPTGMYIYRLQTPRFSAYGKMLLLK